MAIKPILFNTAMVRAILAGRKTMTRRLFKQIPQNTECKHELYTFNDMLPEYAKGNYECACRKCGWGVQRDGTSIFKPPCIPGDVLYVRESFCSLPVSPGGHTRINGVYYYKADGDQRPDAWRGNWKPSIHMPKEAARIFLRVVGVRVERLQNISNEEIAKEGIQLTPRESECKCAWESPGCRQQPCGNRDAFEEGKYTWKFAQLWDSTIRAEEISDYGFSADPWVWVIEFERCEKPEGFL